MGETKDDEYSPEEPVPTTSNSNGKSPSYTEAIDSESRRMETFVGDSVASVVTENEDPSVRLQNISESPIGAKIINDSPSCIEHVDTESHRKEKSVKDSVASVVLENKDSSAGMQIISESTDETKTVHDFSSCKDHADTASHGKETSVEDSGASVIQDNKGLSADLGSIDDAKGANDDTGSIHIGSQNISDSTDDTKIVNDSPSYIDHTDTESHSKETSVENSVASVVQENKDPSADLGVDDVKTANDDKESVHIGPTQLEAEKAGNDRLSNKSKNGLSVADKDIQKHGYSNEKKISGDRHVSLAKPSAAAKAVKVNRGLVDTAAPFESVKEAVTKFGGIVDWKAHKTQILERRRLVQLELEKVKREIPVYKEQSEAAENAKADLLKELDETKRFIEELKLALEKAQTEESQAKQDLELVQLRMKEIDQGIAGEASVAAKAQVDVVKARNTAAVAELKSVQKELDSMQKQHEYLINEKNNAIKRAEAAASISRDIEKKVEDLTIELIAAREALESAHASHMEAEEHRIGAVLARDQDVLNWEKELKQAEDDLQLLNEKLLSVKDLESKLATASTSLLNLKAELAAYMEAKLSQEAEDAEGGKAKNDNEVTATHASIHEAIASIKRETEDVNSNIVKMKEEAKCLNVAAASLKSEIDAEKAALTNMQQREGMALIAVQALEAELNRIRTEIEVVQAKEKETKNELVKLPEALQKASWEADEAKSAADAAFEELRKAKEEVEQIKASASTIESRLNASLKEIEAAKASERIALLAIKALQESEQTASTGPVDLDAGSQVTIPLEEYYALSKRAYEAEEQANQKVSAAISQIQVAKVSESQALENLAEANRELDGKKEALRAAKEKAERATQGKLGAEQELRKWRADHERRRKAGEESQVVIPSRSPERSMEKKSKSELGMAYAAHATPSGVASFSENSTSNAVPEVKSRKKKTFFPRFIRFLVTNKSQRVD